ncbi:alpha/beta fold hydrolase [Tenacibaculum sp. UWU-22]|uniref:alpha/beta fold hydrolase n=1 Tax=Tenacibaculum sp. UWU-22 TaxID=3234187 RepID=UPI0034DB0E28
MPYLNNTKTLPPSFNVPKKIIVCAKVLQFISHNLVAWLAAKLFIRPVNYPVPKRERYMEDSAQKKELTLSNNEKINVLSYGYSKRKILLVHGWSGRSTQLYRIADMLLEKGYMVISFDAPAHGKSTGKTSTLLQFLETIKVIQKQFGPFEAAVGHSLGAMSLFSAVNEGFKIKKMVSIGAGDKISDIILYFTNTLKLKPIIAKKMKAIYDKKWKLDIDIYASSLKAKTIKIPILIIHDANDGNVPVSCAFSIRKNLQNGVLLITRNLGHVKILNDKNTASRVVDFINNSD